MRDLISVQWEGLPSKRDLLLFDRFVVLTGQETLKGGPPDEETDEGITLQLQGPKPKVVTKVVTRYVKKGLFGLPSPAAFADFQYLVDKRVLVPGLSPEERDAMRDLAADLRSELGDAACAQIRDAFLSFEESRIPPELSKRLSELPEEKIHYDLEKMERGFLAYTTIAEGEVRIASAVLTKLGADAVANLRDLPRLQLVSNDRFQRTLHAILTRLPSPAEDVSFDQLFDFRQDEDARRRLIELRHWFLKLVRTDITKRELEDELDYLLHEYETHMQHHRMRFRYSALGCLLLASAEVLDNLIRFKFRPVVDQILKIGEQKLEMLSVERAAPGREVAYIAEAARRFGAATEWRA
jgi:hypothetical protein